MSPTPADGAARDEAEAPSARSPIPADYDRLRGLYELQTALARSTGIAQACATTLSIVAQALAIRTALLLDATRDVHLAFAWAAEGTAPAALEVAQQHARAVLAYLTPTTAVPDGERRADVPGGAGTDARDRHYVTLPLSLATGQVFGVFQLEGATPFEERDLLYIDAVVNHLATTFERHHAEAARAGLELANRRLGELQGIAHAALHETTLEATVRAILDAVGVLFATTIAAVVLASPDGATARRWTSTSLAQPPDANATFGVAAVRRLAAADTAIVFDDPGALDDLGPMLRANGVGALAGARLRARERVIGAVYAGSHERGRFTRDDAQLLELVADRIAIILERATVHEAALAAVGSHQAVLGMVSHDLMNPLSTIQMWTELLVTDDPRVIKGMSAIRRSVARMHRMIGDLLDIDSIEAGHLSIKMTPECADALVEEVLEGVRAAALRKALRLETRLPATAPVLACDRGRIVQVLTNLITNAIKFTPEGGTIALGLVAEGDSATFSVADSGCGIPASDLTHVFEPHWQATATADQGRGLGLAIAKGIIEGHGGALSVESRVGQGTTFAFTLPLARDPDARPHAATGA